MRPIEFQLLEFGFQLEFPQYTHVFDHTNTLNCEMRKILHAPHLLERHYCVNRGACMREIKAKTL